MKIAIIKERRPYEKRVAATPETVKKYRSLGHEVAVETGAGLEASFPDGMYEAAGAAVAPDAVSALSGADVVLKVQRPLNAGEGLDEIGMIPPGALLIGMLNPYAARGDMALYAAAGITSMAMELMPRITRAQAMDVLSSQSNLVGYRAVIEAAAEFGRAFPMMMTAAGTVAPARVFVMGAGVAGLQAIATARRLGAVVSATDVRPAAREQVQSLGASFVMVENEESKRAETESGYAKEMSREYMEQQNRLVSETIKSQDIVICTALIPGRAAPRLVTAEMVRSMKPGSIIVDLAVEQGGNCELSESGKIVEAFGVKIIAHRNMPSRIPVDASSLYARNLLNLLSLVAPSSESRPAVDLNDEIISAIVLTHAGNIVHPQFRS